MSTTATAVPYTFNADLAHLPAALLPLTKQKRWAIWRWEERTTKTGVKWTKPPYQPQHPKRAAKSNDPATWGSYEDAVLAFTTGKCAGIGFMLKDSDLGAIDLDHIRDFATGQVLCWAEELFIEAANAGCYLEWTVSGTGARIIGIVRGSELHRKINLNRKTGCAVEFYQHCARYITISGLQISGDYPGLSVPTEMAESDALFNALFARFCDNECRLRPQDCEFRGGLHIGVEEIPEDEDQNQLDFNDAAPQETAQTSNPYDFNDVGPQVDPTDYEDLIQNGAPEGERSEGFARVVWYLASQGWSAEEIAEELARHSAGIGAKYAGRLPAEVARCYSKWSAHQRAAATGGTATTAGGAPWPQIKVIPGELPRVVDEAEDALLLLGREIYQRSGVIVRPILNKSLKASDGNKIEGWQLIEIDRPYLVELLCCAAQFQQHDARAKKFVPIDAPEKVARAYLSRRGLWKLPHLIGVVSAPFIRIDGSICETPGYDFVSYVLFKPQTQIFPPIPQNPSKADAAAALKKLRKLIETFPFKTSADRSVALAAMLTVLDRRSISKAPLIGFSAPMPRTGKSLLVKLMGILATGQGVPTKSQGTSEEEFEKRLGGNLLDGDVCISIDNCSRPLTGDMLCQALSEDEVEVRVLGHNSNIRTATIATIFATGNNLVIAEDLTDRSLLCYLDAGVERPGEREFPTDVEREARAKRGELVVAALTIIRTWHIARTAGERVSVNSFGGFEDWSRRVREALIWLGEADPNDTMKRVKESDPVREDLVAVQVQWKEHLGTGANYTVQEVINRAINIPTFYTALVNVAVSNTGSTISNARLGRWLRRVEGTICNGFKMIRVSILNGYPIWSLRS